MPFDNQDHGGGMYVCEGSCPSLINVVVANNSAKGSGGGIYCDHSFPVLMNATIAENTASSDGGGLYCASSAPVFDSINRSDIYFNMAFRGNDLYSDTVIQVVLDTFTVLTPMQFHAFPLVNFSFDILHGKTEQVNADLYVSPSGDNTNSGLTASDPLKTIHCALSKILTDSLNPHTIHLLNGTYGPTQNGELLPIVMGNYLSLDGESEAGVVLDAENQNSVIIIDQNTETSLSDMTISGASDKGISIVNSEPDMSGVTLANNQNGMYCDNSSPALDSITFINNAGYGLHCVNSSNPSITNCVIKANINFGVQCDSNSNPVIVNSTIGHNFGGGLRCYHSNPILDNVTIANNSSDQGAGIYCEQSNPVLENVVITNNVASSGGGGLFCVLSSPAMDSVIISGNSASAGGGIFLSQYSMPYLKTVTINNNSANEGGGLYCSSSFPSFDEINRCNIYMNSAYLGNDLFADTLSVIVVDTFTVLTPTQFFAHPLNNFSFDILHGKLEQVNADLYVSPSGENTNSGLSADDPLKTIHCALSKILTDSLNPHTIHLMNGTYSTTSTGEYFPVVMGNYLSLYGESEEGVVLDGEAQGTVIYMDKNIETHLTSLTINGGSDNAVYIEESTAGLQNLTISNNQGCGISCINSSPLLEHLTLSFNMGYGIHCNDGSQPLINHTEMFNNGICGILCTNNSNPILENVQISGSGQGGMHCSHSSPILHNVVISDNSSGGYGGGMRCEDNSCPFLEKVLITQNDVWQNFGEETFGGGMYCAENSIPILVNVEISDNHTENGKGGGLYFSDSNPILLDVNLIYNTAERGGAIFFNNSDALIYNSTLAQNEATVHGGAVFASGGSAVQLINSVLWNNTVEQIALVGVYGGQNSAAISYSDVQGGEEGIFLSGLSSVSWMEGNLDEDPLFAVTGDYPYALSDDSPCINTGNPDTTGLNVPAFDLAGNQRYRGGRIDMGAYENQNVTTFINPVLPAEVFKLLCSPNPFSDELTITYHLSESAYTRIEIYNSAGKEVIELSHKLQSGGRQVCKIKTTDLPAGVYYCVLKTNERIQTRKIIKL